MKIVGRKEIGSGKWLALEQLEYRDGDRTRFWETVSRKRCAGAVLLIAELLPSHRLLLIRQYRPPAPLCRNCIYCIREVYNSCKRQF